MNDARASESECPIACGLAEIGDRRNQLAWRWTPTALCPIMAGPVISAGSGRKSVDRGPHLSPAFFRWMAEFFLAWPGTDFAKLGIDWGCDRFLLDFRNLGIV